MVENLSVFEFQDYKDFLKSLVESGTKKRTGYRARLAASLGVPPSFISQVLHAHVHLTLDHGFKLTSYLGLPEDERDYFLYMIQLARAGSRELQGFLKSQMAVLKRRNRDLATKFKDSKVDSSQNEWVYYSSWHLGAIHVAITVPELKKPKALSERLGLPLVVVEESLKKLEKMELAEKKPNGEWGSTQKKIHLSRNSPVSPANHIAWRNKVQGTIFQNLEDNLHYTCLYTLSRADVAKVRNAFVEAISKSREIAHPSPEEEVICVNLDMFMV